MQKKFKWGFALAAVVASLFFLSLVSCSDDGGSSGSGGGSGNPNIIGEGETLSFDFDSGQMPESCRQQVIGKRELPLGVECPVTLHHQKSGQTSQRVNMALANVRLVVVPGTGRAEMMGPNKDVVKATKAGNFTLFAVIFHEGDSEIKNKADLSMADILNYSTQGKIWGVAQFELEGVAGSSAQKSLLSIVLAGASLSVKAGTDTTLPTATLYYSDGSSVQDSSTTVAYSLVGADSEGKVALGSGKVSIVGGQIKADENCSDGTVQVYAEKDGVKSNNFTVAVKSTTTADEEKTNPLTSIELTKIEPTGEVKSGAVVKVKIMGTYQNNSTPKNLSSQMTFMENQYIDAKSIIDGGEGNDAYKQFTAPVTKADQDVTIQVVDSATKVMGRLTITVKGTGDSGVVVPGADQVTVQTATGTITMDFAAATGENKQESAEELKPNPGQGDGGGGDSGDQGGGGGGTTSEDEEKKTVTAIPTGKKAIFVKADSAPTLWVWSKTMSTSELEDGKTAWPGGTMVAAGDYMNDGTGWFVKFFKSENIDAGDLNMHLNGGSAFPVGKMTVNKLYWDGKTASATDPTKAPDPEKPTITISPSSGKVPLTSTITVSISKNLSAFKSITVNIDGAVTTDLAAANATSVYSVSKKVTKSAGDEISVSVSATNGVGTTTASASLTVADIKEDVFTWDNIYCYYVLTDRFNNGDTSNDHSYNRKNSGIPNVATFHGGDLKGLTKKIDYFDKLGVNAIWITAPYEQAHGWTDGKDGAFPHYSFHGYYTMDWTSLDANMGTLEEYREFVNACHSKGIRVVMDVVMNHTGYNTVEDMITYDFGGFKGTPPGHGWAVATGGKWSQGDGAGVDWNSTNWGKWWGCWVRAFDGKFGFAPNGSGDITMSLAGLPDVVTEKTDEVTIPTFLKKKWDTENTGSGAMKNYANPTVANMDFGGMSGDWRTDSKGAPADYIVAWLSAWVRELGIDGFRCDTAKHVHMNRWGQLKDACEAALAAWRLDGTKSKISGKYDGSAAATWTQKFWMTGECFGWSSTSGQGDYYSTGKFDSMINFSFNGVSGSTGHAPTTSDWGSYVNINKNQDSDGNGNRNSVLSYVSSHDTGLHRSTGSIKLGTMLGLLPGGVQVYYGDETDRPNCDGGGDADMKTRGDMNFLADTDPKIVHWSKIGRFRKFNPAVGAGTGDAYHRSYKGNEVYIAAGNTVTLLSGDWWNWYTGTKVTETSVTGSVEAPALISNKEYQ